LELRVIAARSFDAIVVLQLGGCFNKSIPQGAATTVHCLVSAQPEQRGAQRYYYIIYATHDCTSVASVTMAAGMFFMDAAATRMNSLGINPADAKRLWEESESMVKLAATKGGF
jgi:hypothetical protein